MSLEALQHTGKDTNASLYKINSTVIPQMGLVVAMRLITRHPVHGTPVTQRCIVHDLSGPGRNWQTCELRLFPLNARNLECLDNRVDGTSFFTVVMGTSADFPEEWDSPRDSTPIFQKKKTKYVGQREIWLDSVLPLKATVNILRPLPPFDKPKEHHHDFRSKTHKGMTCWVYLPRDEKLMGNAVHANWHRITTISFRAVTHDLK